MPRHKAGHDLHPLYNTSAYTFARLLGDAEHIAPNLVAYINGFSPTARHIFERFKFADQIEKLDASNRLFTIVKAMTDVDLHPDRVDNLQMGYLFEHLVMRFNEQANEEAGDHFTPREDIRLMANLIYTGEQDVYRPGIYRTIYDPACGTGGVNGGGIMRQSWRANTPPPRSTCLAAALAYVPAAVDSQGDICVSGITTDFAKESGREWGSAVRRRTTHKCDILA